MKRIASSFVLAGGLAIAALACGCTQQPEPAQSARAPSLPDPGPDQEYEVKFPEQGPPAWRYLHLAIGDDLSRDCGIVRAHFDFDSAKPLPQDQLALKSVVDCLNRPQMRDLDIEIVGRADSRGSSPYNVDLGRRRAESVKKTLVAAGVDEGRIVTSSMGKAGAVGNDLGSYSYGYDRRVDVTISATAHSPGYR
jgi:peptidoglycan-associated lipoprotein